MKRWLPTSSLVLAFILGACSLTPEMAAPEAAERLPGTFTQAEGDTARTALRWWRAFNDPALDALVDTTLRRNLDLRTAAARVEEVQQLYRISRAPLLPAVNATVEGTRQSTPTNTGPTGEFSANIPQFPDRFDVTTYSASLGLAYEIDFWGRVRSAKNAALHEYFATRADLHTARLGVLSETMATYFEIRELETQLALTRQNVDLLAERVELGEDRYRRGLLTSFELYATRQAFESARAGLPLLEARRYEATGRLGVLLGGTPALAEALLPAADLPLSVEPIPAGLPSTLLLERPDVLAAEMRLEAARQRVGVARAERFPRFSLTAAGGTQSRDLTDLVSLDQRFGLFTGALLAPVFQGGRLKANERAAAARYEQVTAQYEKTVLVAFKEVEAALATHRQERERYAFLQEELAFAEISAETQQARYVRGVGDYLAYLDAQRNLVRVRSSVAASVRALALARLAVHRALGGAWVSGEDGRDV